jgi:integrase
MTPASPVDPSEAPDGFLPIPAPTKGLRPGLEAIIRLVLDAVQSPETRRSYRTSLIEFLTWKDAQGGLPFNRSTVQVWRLSLEGRKLSPSTINLRLGAVRKLAREAAAHGLLDAAVAAGVCQVPGIKQRGDRSGNWLTRQQAQALIEAPPPLTLKGQRDRAILALLVGCGLRRSEAAALVFEDIQQRDGRWVIVDMRGKGGRLRTVPVPSWVKLAIDRWAAAAQLVSGRVLRSMDKGGKITGESLGDRAVWVLAVEYGRSIGVTLAAHDLRRTCAKLCRSAGGELEQIQLLLGHASIQTTERYLGTKQDLTHAPNDRLGLKWRDYAQA